MKKCETCKYSRKNWTAWIFGLEDTLAKCVHKKTYPPFMTTRMMRHFNDKCGYNAKLWEPKKMKKGKDCNYNKVDQKNWIIGVGQLYAKCQHEEAKQGFAPIYSDNMRLYGMLCGKEGKLWEPKK